MSSEALQPTQQAPILLAFGAAAYEIAWSERWFRKRHQNILTWLDKEGCSLAACQEVSCPFIPPFLLLYRLERPERRKQLVSLLEHYGRSYAISHVYPPDWQVCSTSEEHPLWLYIHALPLANQILPTNDPQPVDQEVLRESIRLSLQLLRVQIYHDEDGWSLPPRELALCAFGILAAQGYRGLRMNEDFEYQVKATLHEFA